MSLWTLDEVTEMWGGLKQALLDDPAGTLGSVSINGRMVQYRSTDDLLKLINFYAREIARLERIAAGGRRTNYAVARFN